MCIDMCEDAFANTTSEFEWVAAGVLTELRAIIITLEPKFNMMSLHVSFQNVADALSLHLTPLMEKSRQLEAVHKAHLAELKAIEAKQKRQSLIRQMKLEAQSKNAAAGAAERSLMTEKKARLSEKSEKKTTWTSASEPAPIEVATLGSILALVAGMLLAHALHGGPKAAFRSVTAGPALSENVPVMSNMMRTTNLRSGGVVRAQYGAHFSTTHMATES